MKPDPGGRVGRRGLLLGAAAAAALGTGCSFTVGRDHRGPDAPQALPLTRPVGTAWVLSSGGPRGFTHVGVLKALDDLGLRPDLIVGASVGALVGSLRAAGLGVHDIESLALDLQPLMLARLAIGADERFSVEPLAELVRSHVPVQRLERMPVAMACVAARRRDATVVAFTAGDAGVAVMASAAIVGQFAPVQIEGDWYADADGLMPLPVRAARALGARRVLAVDASVHLDRAPPEAGRYRAGDLLKQALVQADAREADLVVKPDFGYWVSLSQDFRRRAIEAGYRDTMALAAPLRALHAS